MNKEKLISRIRIFSALNGRQMTVGDFVRQCSDDELAEFFSEKFCNGKQKNELLKMMKSSANEILKEM